MDEKYIFTRAEFAKMLDVSPNTIRMRMRRGHFAEDSKYIKNKWMFRRPRPSQLVRPAPSSLSLDTGNKRRGITKHGTTNYDNIKNPVTARKFEEQNDKLRLDKKWGHLSEKQLDALLLLANKEQQKDLEERQKKAFEDPFMLSEKAAHKKRHDEWLMEQDRLLYSRVSEKEYRERNKKEYY